MSAVLNLLKSSPYAKYIPILLAVIAVLVIVLPLLRKLRRKQIKQKETKEIMRDLTVWRHLSQLVQGGEQHEKAKQMLSDSIARIRELIKEGLVRLADYGKGLYDTPWYFILGEPHSGKSSLLAESALELTPSAEEQADPEDVEGKTSLPVRFWYGAKALVCDISGRVFFDRWLEGSSAEWSYIVRQLCRRHRRKPFGGIILTIPADALLSDSDSLSHKKAVLMANELSFFLNTSGMCLPCFVVVTKLDMVNGFREYAADFRGELRHQMFGYVNHSAMYSGDDFKTWWDSTVDTLTLGANQILSRFVIPEEEEQVQRMDVNGKIFVFPQNFSGLYKNLNVYLSALFGAANYHGTKKTWFEGVAFTSSTDTGVTLSPKIARLAGEASEDFVLQGKRPSRPQSYFLRDMLHRWVFAPNYHAAFTGKNLIIQNIPRYVASAALAGLGITWIFAGAFRKEKLAGELSQQVAYYDSLDALLKKGTPFESPIIRRDDTSGGFVLDERPITGERSSSRMQFYFNALSYRDMKASAPLGFKLAKTFVFGFRPNMGYKDKAYVANQLYGSMIRTPLLKSFGQKITDEQLAPVVLDTNLRQAIGAFVMLDKLKNADLYSIFSSKDFKIEPMIRHVLGDISNNSMNLLSSYLPKFDRNYSFTLDAAYIYSPEFLDAKRAANRTIITAWQRGSVYPDSLYGKIKRLVSISENIVKNYAAMTDALKRINSAVTIDDVRKAVTEWKALSDKQNSLAGSGRTLFEEVTESMVSAKIPVSFKSGPKADAFGDNLINTYLFNDLVLNHAVGEYAALFARDMSFVRSNSNGNGETGAAAELENEFERNMAIDIETLRQRAMALRDDDLLVKRIEDKPGAESFFLVTESILRLASAIEIPAPENLRRAEFDENWRIGRYDISGALDDFENYVKPYAENKNLAGLIANARSMLLAQAYLNRYIVFDTSLPFLRTNDEIIAANVQARSSGSSVFSFSDKAMQDVLGSIYMNPKYDPQVVKTIMTNIVTFANLFSTGDMPPFLKNQDTSLYETDALRAYLAKYLRYWRDFGDNAYVPARSWQSYKNRVATFKPYQINTVLQDLYAKCSEFLGNVSDLVLSQDLKNERNAAIAFQSDRINLLSTFMSADADRMFAAWAALPDDPEAALRVLRSLSDQQVKESYMTVYSGQNTRIGWWDSFVLDGVGALNRTFTSLKLDAFRERLDSLKAYPLVTDGDSREALTFEQVASLGALLDDMGANLIPRTPPKEGENPPLFRNEIYPILFSGMEAEQWAQTVGPFAIAVAGQKPLLWTLSQPPFSVQETLAARVGRLSAVSRYRYVEVVSGIREPLRLNTYTAQNLTLAQGRAEDSGLTLRLYRTSEDRRSAAEYSVEDPWTIIALYTDSSVITGDKGQVYVPVFFEDGQGKYAYFVEITFSAALPPPASWYTTLTWPVLKADTDAVRTGTTISAPSPAATSAPSGANPAEAAASAGAPPSPAAPAAAPPAEAERSAPEQTGDANQQ